MYHSVTIVSLFSENIFSDPWKGMSSPKKIVWNDVGLVEGTVWAIDNNHDIFYFDGSKWDIEAGKLEMITVGESGIFGINPTNKSIYWRQGADFDNPKGIRWQMVSRNTKGIKFIESVSDGIIYGLDAAGILHYTDTRDKNQLDFKWLPISIEVEGSGKLNDRINVVSCGVFSCWIVTSSGSIYGMSSPWIPNNVKWTSVFGKSYSLRKRFR